MSGGARQKRILAGPSAVSAPAVGRMYAGRLITCPAAASWSSHVAIGVASWMHACCDAAGTAPGGATMIGPASGSSAPPSASAATCALTVPIGVPAVWFVVRVVPDGTYIVATAVASSAGAADAVITVVEPA